MKYLSKYSLLYIICVFPFDFSFASPSSRQFRYMSFMIRDRPPSIEEAKDFHSGVKTIDGFVNDWVQSPDFEMRLSRFFNDWFGIGEEVEVLEFNHYLTPNASGILHQANKGDCTPAEAVQVSAWWLEPGQTISVCSNMVSDEIVFDHNTEQERFCPMGGAQGILHPDCGCGPEMILCLPMSLQENQKESLRREFRDRAVYAFHNQMSWSDLLGGNFFYGNRYLYHMYLVTSGLHVVPRKPTADELRVLYSLSLETPSRASFPNSENLRAGVVTGPAFLQQFNNFRSRIRALSNTLLCRDIDSSLNTDGISIFVNPDLSDFDRQHGDDEGCASCHYSMDNLGSMLLGWGPNGYLERWKNLSQLGHAFGQGGTGPADLMNGFVSRGPGFLDCMSQKSWEDFTGEPWSQVDESKKTLLMEAAQSGPYQLIITILHDASVHQNRYASLAVASSTAEKPNFSAVAPILIESCAGSSCHSAGTTLGTRYEYINNETHFSQAPALRLSNGSMPPSGVSLSTEKRNLLIRFLNGS